MHDLRFAWRTLSARKLHTAIAVLCLGIGIGVNTVVFSMVNGILFRPFPYRGPDELVALRSTVPERGVRSAEIAYADFAEWRRGATQLTGMGAYFDRSYTLSIDNDAEQLEATAVTADLLPTLGISPALGRGFRADEDRPGAPRVVLLSHTLWTERFNADSAVLGRSIMLSATPHTIIGVMPRGFGFAGQSRLWTPMALDENAERGNHYMEAIGRLKPGASSAAARAELDAISRQLAERFPDTNAGWGANVISLREHEVGKAQPLLLIMQGAVLLVLLIACANVANLFLAQGVGRQREIAIRSSLGAGRARVVRQLLLEALLVAVCGAALGLLLAMWTVDLVRSMFPSLLPFWVRFDIDARVLGFTIAAAGLTALVAGVIPAWRVSRPDLSDVLKAGGRGSSHSRAHQGLRGALVVGEMALAVVLVVGASLLVRSFVHLTRTDPGFAVERSLTMFVSLRDPRYNDLFARTAALDRILERIRAIAGVREAAGVSEVPLNGNNRSTGIFAEGEPIVPGKAHSTQYRIITPEYFSALEIPILRGRTFTRQEVADSSRVAVVGETFAKRHFPNDEAVGKRFILGGGGDELYTIIGIAGDTRMRRLDEPPAAQMYFTSTRNPTRVMNLVVATAGDPASFGNAVRAAVRETAPGVPVYRLATMRAVYDQSLWQERVIGQLFGAFAVIALILAALGVYGVMAYNAAQRTQEIGVRVALGARRSDVMRLVTRGALALGGAGALLGTLLAAAVSGVLRDMLYGVSPTDPTVLVGVPLSLVAVALIASVIPARRAALVDPVDALRVE